MAPSGGETRQRAIIGLAELRDLLGPDALRPGGGVETDDSALEQFVDEALTQLAEKHPDKARLVNLRYFGGLTNEEAAAALGISTSTADRHWAYAKAWLYRKMASA